jgi:hypothetical protein
VWRELANHGRCANTHRHALAYRDQVAPRHTAQEKRLSRIGACCCDCELFLYAYEPDRRLWTPEREEETESCTIVIEVEPPAEMPACVGVRRGSVGAVSELGAGAALTASMSHVRSAA